MAVTRVAADRVWARGLDNVAAGELVDIAGTGLALVVALHPDEVELAPMDLHVPDAGAAVSALGAFDVPCGDDLLGRVVDAAGRVVDGAALARDHVQPVWFRDRVIEPGSCPYSRLSIGFLAFDLQHAMAAGARILAIAGPQLVDDLVRLQLAAGRIVIVAHPAGDAETLVRHDGAWIGITPPRDAGEVQRYLVPWTALAIAHGFRERGRDVVVVLDSIESWQFGVRQFPLRGDLSAQLAAIAERANRRSGGSISLIALTRGQPTVELAEAFDHVIDLDSIARGVIPTTRTKLVQPPLRVPSRAELGSVIVATMNESNPSHFGALVRECLRWQPKTHASAVEQLSLLYAVIDRQLSSTRATCGQFSIAIFITSARTAHHSSLRSTA